MIALWPENEKASAIKGQLYKGTGCENCINTGYLGRTGIFELLVIDDDIKELIGKSSASHIIKEAAIEKGMSTLREAGSHRIMCKRKEG